MQRCVGRARSTPGGIVGRRWSSLSGRPLRISHSLDRRRNASFASGAMLRQAARSIGRRGMMTAGFGSLASPFLTSSLLNNWGTSGSSMAGLEGALLTAGNPLLDISAVVSQELLDKYGVRGWT